MLYRKRGKAMMDMKFSPDWLRRVAKEEEDVRFSVGGWTSGIIRPPNFSKRLRVCYHRVMNLTPHGGDVT
jgi:hypothetical protein